VEIQYEDIHPQVKPEIDKLFSVRKARWLQTAAAAPTLGLGIPVATNINVPPLTAGLFLIGGLTGYAIGSGPVGLQTQRVAEAVSRHGLLADGKQKHYAKLPGVSELRKTHPFLFVDGKKSIILLPDNGLERIAQELPLGRKRARY
jgi:hypothetical protein